MHRSLLLDEIMRYIFEALHAGGQLSTLASLAVTCRAFHEPALDVLWKEIDGLAPLVKCFPADAWAVERSWQTSPKRLNMTRPLLAQDWRVVLTYANRIKALSYDIYGGPNLDPNVLQALLVFRPTLILFPKLHKLHWRQGLSNLSAMITLIGPELKTLEIFMRSSSEDDIRVIKSTSAYIGARCPNLESVTFVDMFGTTPPVLDVDNLIASSKCLQHFMCLDNITCSQSSLLALAKLENLLELRLRLPDGMCFPALMGFETFPALRHLTIRGHFLQCLNFFEAMDLARLETLHIVVDSRRDHPNIRSLLTAIRFGPDHFRMTTINLHIRAEPSASMSLISSDDIRPLFVLRNLRKVTILAETFTCEGSLYQDMATAWPHLVTLCVLMPSEAPITLALIPFATHCPQLKYLTASCNVDGRDLTADYTASLGLFSGGSSPSIVTSLHFRTSVIRCPERVVAFLLYLFPDIRRVLGLPLLNGGVGDQRLESERHRTWEEVKRYIPILRECILRDRRSRTGTAGHRTPLADSVL